MGIDLLDSLDQIARKIARKHSIIEQNKLQAIEIDIDDFYSLITEFKDFNLSDTDIEYQNIAKVMENAFSYFYIKGIEAAINKHFSLSSELIYDQMEMIQLNKPNFPDSIDMYINYIALIEISIILNKYIIENKEQFEQEAYYVEDLCEQTLLIAFNLGGELATLIPLKRLDFGLERENNSSIKVDVVDETYDMSIIYCPFCHHHVYTAPKEKEFRDLSRINNCMHISAQYFQGKDKAFIMSDGMRQILNQTANDFLSGKSNDYMFKLHDFLLKPEYTTDDLLMDIYVNRKISKEEEIEFLSIMSEIASNYEIKVSDCKINGEVVVNYFLKEKIF